MPRRPDPGFSNTYRQMISNLPKPATKYHYMLFGYKVTVLLPTNNRELAECGADGTLQALSTVTQSINLSRTTPDMDIDKRKIYQLTFMSYLQQYQNWGAEQDSQSPWPQLTEQMETHQRGARDLGIVDNNVFGYEDGFMAERFDRVMGYVERETLPLKNMYKQELKRRKKFYDEARAEIQRQFLWNEINEVEYEQEMYFLNDTEEREHVIGEWMNDSKWAMTLVYDALMDFYQKLQRDLGVHPDQLHPEKEEQNDVGEHPEEMDANVVKKEQDMSDSSMSDTLMRSPV
ncbi:hypothetical protein FPQ18DRAFT_415072 [Pyronema domesticum]|uniref:Uncharacterized protein n=1 Tax=Pyronema omphalodes (strain CBS 100304) TaxID=1076935 RepID=U4L3V3_PYROM|nr:hypothetical protein FPQ18DRAFT_415072 [Pyronema domesticum]CCX04735.1 Protein of unknown function [Pyronema omphalodes CBS 100304]